MGSRVPARHSTYIRPPSNTEDREEENLFSQSARRGSPNKIIAYVAHAPACIFSEDLVDLAEELGVVLTIYDVQEVSPPEYITGTPSIETSEGEIYCGDSAFSWIMNNAPSPDENVQILKDPEPGMDFLSSTPEEGAGCSIQDAMRESERIARVAECSISEPLCDVQKSLDKMLASRKH